MTSHSSTTARIKGIIFDVGRVIIRLNPERPLRRLGSRSGSHTGPAPEEFWSLIQSDPLWPDWQEGRLTPQEWHGHISRRLGLTLRLEEFASAWNAALEPETLLEESLFAELGGRFRLALLSNTDPIHVAEIESRFTFVRHFPARIYSCRVGAAKPSPAIYRAALASLNLEPAEALYIDDMAEFVEAARQLGMQGIRFESPAQLAEELGRRGILSASKGEQMMDVTADGEWNRENDGAE